MSVSLSRFCTLLILLSCLVVPAYAVESSAIALSNDETSLIELSSMQPIGEMITLGVVARAYITAIEPGNNNATHRVVVKFVNKKSGVAVAKALVGIKHRKLFGNTSNPVWMRSSAAQPELFVADVALKHRGTYLFIVGSKLEDEKKRQFTFQYRH